MNVNKTKLALAFGALLAVGLVGCNKAADEAAAPAASATMEAPADTMPAEPMTPAMPSTAAMPTDSSTMPSASTMTEPAPSSTAQAASDAAGAPPTE